jgi:hypothetical protein
MIEFVLRLYSDFFFKLLWLFYVLFWLLVVFITGSSIIDIVFRLPRCFVFVCFGCLAYLFFYFLWLIAACWSSYLVALFS